MIQMLDTINLYPIAGPFGMKVNSSGHASSLNKGITIFNLCTGSIRNKTLKITTNSPKHCSRLNNALESLNSTFLNQHLFDFIIIASNYNNNYNETSNSSTPHTQNNNLANQPEPLYDQPSNNMNHFFKLSLVWFATISIATKIQSNRIYFTHNKIYIHTTSNNK
ncbi:hypothetical protein ACTFIU_002699 [Dictyostelium citrinum]